RRPLSVEGKTVILTDDGIATGFTLIAALHSLRKKRVKKTIIAVPVAPAEIKQQMEEEADEVVVLNFSDHFFAVGQFYENFSQTSDAEVIKIMKRHYE